MKLIKIDFTKGISNEKKIEKRMVYNRSYNYALPMLDWWDSDFLINGQLRGCFIGASDCPDLTNNIFLLYRFTGERWFQKFEESLKSTEYFVDFYEVDKNHVMFIYDVPEWHIANMEALRNSAFSKFTDEFKKRIIEFHGAEKTKGIQAVLYKQESAYIELEKYINQGLPRREWTKVPRDIEAAKLLNLEEEYYSELIKLDE